MNPISNLSEECSAVAFYGIEPIAKAAESFYHLIVQWFTELGYPPNTLSVKAPGHSGKMTSFSRGDARLQKSDWKEVVRFTIETRIAVDADGYYLSASYDPDVSQSVSIAARSSIANLSADSMLPISCAIAKLISPPYGIGYHRDHRFGPKFYAIGLNYGPPGSGVGGTQEQREERMNISHWAYNREEQVYLKGVLRDIYPWNFLTAPQLNRPLGDLTLEQWIRQDAARGTLSPFTEKMTLWEVPDSAIPHIRSQLKPFKAIFNWRDYVPGEEQEPPLTPEAALRHVMQGQDPIDVQVLNGETGRELPFGELHRALQPPKENG